ncbi:hypothetical protein BGX24_010264 [Mortierella sp. AD032]|nr:hypothetical protein BGX24_010264 [Mortierella sp. AD032]
MNIGVGGNVFDPILELGDHAELETLTEIAAVAPALSSSLFDAHPAAASKTAHQRLSKGTKSNYDRYIKQGRANAETINKAGMLDTIRPEVPSILKAFIASKREEIARQEQVELEVVLQAEENDPGAAKKIVGTAEQIRAAWKYYYMMERNCQYGGWRLDERGRCFGNPVDEIQLSKYVQTLRKQYKYNREYVIKQSLAMTLQGLTKMMKYLDHPDIRMKYGLGHYVFFQAYATTGFYLWTSLGSQLVWAIFWCCLSFVGPLGLERILHFIKNKDAIPVEWGHFYVLYGWEVSSDDGGGDDDGEKEEEETFTNGAVNNMISIDTNELAQTSNYSHDIVILVLHIFLTTIFLYRILGQSAFAGIIVMASLIPINTRIARLATNIQNDLISATDKRVEQMTQLLRVTRMIMYFSWEWQFYEKVERAREVELGNLRTRMLFWILGTGLWFGTPVAVSVSTFFGYTKVYGNILTAEVAFPALTLFNVLKGPMVDFPNVIAQFISVRVSTGRMDRFLAEEEVQRYSEPIIGFQNASFSYAGKNERAIMDRAFHAGSRLDGHHLELKNFNLHFLVGELSIVTGPTGSGNTSMLLALLGEMNITQRRAFLPRRDDRTINTATGLSNSIGYISQLAWLLNDSIRNSILFGSVFDQTRYDQVVEMCALKRDFEILENGDETEIGEQGVTLSGGQKQCVALARAVYSRAGHILLDDCISALDAHTAKWLFTECLMGPLMVGRTRILVTHGVSLTLRSAAFGVVLKDGTVSFSVSPVEVLESGALDTDFLMDEQTQDVDDKTSGVAPGSSSSTDGGAQLGNATDDDSSATAVPVKEKKKLIGAKGKAERTLDKEVYLSYFRAMGKNMFWTVLLSSFSANQALQVSFDAWLRVWAAAAKDDVEQNATLLPPLPSHCGPQVQMVLSPLQSLVKPMEGLAYYLGV